MDCENFDSSYYSEEEEEVPEKWVTCVVDSDYEICDKYPHNLRRKGTTRNIAQTCDKSDGYLKCKLNGKRYKHHRLVALQFIPNPENKREVDHINRIRNDNHISNLRWVTPAENCQNKGCYKTYCGEPFVFTDEIDDECIKITSYGNRQLENYYYDVNLDQYYHREDDGRYRLLRVLRRKDGRERVMMRDKNNVQFDFSVKKFKQLHDLE